MRCSLGREGEKERTNKKRERAPVGEGGNGAYTSGQQGVVAGVMLGGPAGKTMKIHIQTDKDINRHRMRAREMEREK